MTATVAKLIRIQTADVLRSRWIALYAAFFLCLTEGLLRFSGGDARAVLSLGTAVLMVIPLASLVLATIYVYNAREFTELLLAQPIHRSSLFTGLYLGLSLPMAVAFLAGVGVPFLTRGGAEPDVRGALAMLLVVGALLTFVFTAVAFWIALRTEDRLRGVGIALGVWLLVGVLYDGMVLLGVALFSDYPVERALLALTLANPIDLGRVLLLLTLDVAALMGYTGAVFERFFGGTGGALLALTMLLVWTAVPIAAGARRFRRRDF
ncbi:MAG TPA: ABC transporter permease subunit [Gemmatimonadaceae bacterium]|nr:ABC transporter permease subunit [Gemmatimonadaceae bacterium]